MMMVGTKRRSDHAAGNSSPKRAKQSTSDENVFRRTLRRLGLHMSNECSYELDLEQAIFLRRLTASLSDSNEELRECFLEGLHEHIEDSERLQQSVMFTALSNDCGTESQDLAGTRCDSLLRLCLSVDSIQTAVVAMMLEKLPEFAEDDASTQTVDMPAVIITQLRWLDRVVDPEALSEKLLEMITVTNIAIQREIVAALPEIITDSQHEHVAKALKEMLFEDPQLTVCILDALANLSLSSQLLSEIRTSVMKILPSTQSSQLAVVLRFLLHSVVPSNAVEIIADVRENLDLASSTPVPVLTSTPAISASHTAAGAGADEGELLAAQALHASVRFQKCVGDAWLKVIEQMPTVGKHKPLDLLLMFILHQCPGRHKGVEALIRSKCRDGLFLPDLIEQTFQSHTQALQEYFSSIVSIAESLLRSMNDAVATFAETLYQQVFLNFAIFHQQEVIGALVTHVGGGQSHEVDAALSVLSSLVDTQPMAVSPFVVFLKGMLDYLENLSVTQLRRLFTLLSQLAFCGDCDAGHVADDMHIIIRKQLTNSKLRYKRMGIIGAVSVISAMAAARPGETEAAMTNTETSSQPSTLSGQTYEQTVALLDMVRSNCVQHPLAASLFYDELTAIVCRGRLDMKILTWIADCVVADFQDAFLMESESALPQASPLELGLAYNLDVGDDGSVAVNLMPLLAKVPAPSLSARMSDQACPTSSLISMPSHFSLLQQCEKMQHSQSLEGIDALLGCPLVLCTESVMQKFPSLPTEQKLRICASLLLAINWCREIINAFATQEDGEMKGKVVQRLQNITHLEQVLERCLAVTPSFVPPLAVFDEDIAVKSVGDVISSIAAANGTGSAGSGGGKRGRKPTKKKKAADDAAAKSDDVLSQQDLDGSIAASVPSSIAAAATSSSSTPTLPPGTCLLSHYQACVRELDMDVFCLIQHTCITKKELDSQMHTKTVEIISMQPPQLLLLLSDLRRKLNHILPATVSARGSFLKAKHRTPPSGFTLLQRFKPAEVARRVLDMLPWLCEHVEWAHEFLQKLNDGNGDDDLDDASFAELMDCGESKTVREIYRQIMKIITILLSWNGLSSLKVVRRDIYRAFAARLDIGESKKSQHLSFLASQSFQYLQNFSTTLPDLSTATLLCQQLQVLRDEVDTTALSAELSEVAGSFLQKEWPSEKKSTKANESLVFLLKLHITCAEDPLSVMETIAGKAAPELLSEDIHQTSLYPTLNRLSFPSFYRCLLHELVALLRSQPAPRAADAMEVKREQLTKLQLFVGVFYILINLVKAFDVRPVLGNALKYGRMFVETFLRLGMPVLDSTFRVSKEDVQSLLKTLQQSTRSLHHFSGHSKVMKDVVLTNHVPALKKCLEAFVFRVKAMLSVNDCHQAFWIGNLKNRDIQGEEILSQTPQQVDDAGNESDQQLSEEGSDSEDEG
eukprot:scpid12328/ scgid27700/ Fanconi anemia group D2 protein